MSGFKTGVLALALAAALAAGCGSDDDEGEPLTKQELIQQGDELCQNARVPLPRSLKDAKDAAKFTQESIDARVKLDDELKDLNAPDEVSKDFDAFNLQTSKMLDNLRAAKAAADKDEEERFGNLMQEFDRNGRERDRIADRIGFKRCGQPLAQGQAK